MKFTVIIPSRGRVRGLSAAIYSLEKLSSGRHDITYAICCDEDDPPTKLFAVGLQTQLQVAVRVGPRPVSLGGVINDMAERVPADVYCSFTDDLLCLAPDWDEEIARSVEAVPHGVFWWRNALPQDSLFAVVTEKWRAAAGGIFTDHYPFWFDDWCLIELWFMATGLAPLRLEAKIADKPRHTHRLRDLLFWQRFYQFTRGARLVQAREIAAKLGLPVPLHAEETAARLMATLKPMPIEMIAQIETQGDVEAPDASYLVAKARAEAMMQEAA